MKSKWVKMVAVVILIADILFLSGCMGKREVDELAAIIGIGIDKGQKPGTYLVTYQFLVPKKGGASGKELSEGRTLSVEAFTAREAHEKMAKITSRMPFMGSLKLILLGEDIARDGFLERLDFEQRFSEFRRSLFLVQVKGKAVDILNVKLAAEEMSALYIKRKFEEWKRISIQPQIDLGHYLTVIGDKSTAPVLPLVEIIKPGEEGIVYHQAKEVEELQFGGAGVFRTDRLVDFLTDEETKGYMWLTNKVGRRFVFTGKDDNEVIFGGQVIGSRTKYKVSAQDGTAGIQYQIKVNYELDEVHGINKQYSEQEWSEFVRESEGIIAQQIEQECEQAIQKAKKLGLDFLGIGRHIEEKKPAYWKTVKEQWEQKLVDFPISLNIQVVIVNSGMSGSSIMTKSMGEGEE